MKKFILEFLRRGLVSCGFGPIVLAILYLILQQNGVIETLTVNQVSIGIFSVTALAFVAGGLNAIYQVERLPLMVAIFVHGIVLYVTYLSTFLLNDWIDVGVTPLLIFTGIFVLGYLVIWAIIYCIIKKNTEELNSRLRKKQLSEEV